MRPDAPRQLQGQRDAQMALEGGTHVQRIEQPQQDFSEIVAFLRSFGII